MRFALVVLMAGFALAQDVSVTKVVEVRYSDTGRLQTLLLPSKSVTIRVDPAGKFVVFKHYCPKQQLQRTYIMWILEKSRMYFRRSQRALRGGQRWCNICSIKVPSCVNVVVGIGSLSFPSLASQGGQQQCYRSQACLINFYTIFPERNSPLWSRSTRPNMRPKGLPVGRSS